MMLKLPRGHFHRAIVSDTYPIKDAYNKCALHMNENATEERLEKAADKYVQTTPEACARKVCRTKVPQKYAGQMCPKNEPQKLF